jgi:SEC-C motif-containing protein
MKELCVCCSGKSHKQCCGRFLDNGALAKTPEQLMRSRYSAFALGDHGDYLLQTWFPPTAGKLTAETLSRRDREWTRLEILSKAQQGDKGWVEFNAWYRDEAGRTQVLHEKSIFQRSGGRWLYVGGEVSSTPGQA